MLHQSQIVAINQTSGPCIILAGAGTGKTHTILEKISHIIQKKIHPAEKIVCMTFSNEAANNLLTRIKSKLPENEKEPIIKTFHAFSADLLRAHGSLISIDPNFSILTPEDAKILLHKNLKVTSINCHKYISSIGIAKDLDISQEQLQFYLEKESSLYLNTDLEKRLENLQFELQTLHLKSKSQNKKILVDEITKVKSIINTKKFLASWKAYEKIKNINNYLDYSDLNTQALKLLKNNPEISSNYSYIIVDEFQDTNKIQLDLLKYLSPHKNITVVGDLNQSIYRFRGAYKKNYEEFKEHFEISQNQIHNLDKSFRSPNKVLEAAHNLIINNYKNKEESFQVFNFQNKEGPNIEVYELKDSKEESRKVSELVEKELAEGIPPEEICIMFRTHQQGRIIRRALDFKKIPYCSITKPSLFKQKSIKTIIDYLVILNKLKSRSKGGEQNWWDLIYQTNFPEQDLIKIGALLKKSRELENTSALLLTNLPFLELSPEGKMKSSILLERIKKLLPETSKEVPELILKIYNISGLNKREKTKEEKETFLNINKFHELANNHGVLYSYDLTSFIHHLETINSLGIEIPSPELESKGVRLMTLHAVKGLEYKTVIMTNLSQSKFPMIKRNGSDLIPLQIYPELRDLYLPQRVSESARRVKQERVEDACVNKITQTQLAPSGMEAFIEEYDKENQLFEERRLCYVAFTRSKNKLILTHAAKYNNRLSFPSQFLQEIKYKQNPNIDFYIDNEIKYREPEPEIKTAINIIPILRNKDFKTALQNVIQNSKTQTPQTEKITFSPSSLNLFESCQKKYEYKYKYNMPDEKIASWEIVALGSFVHKVLEDGVNKCFKTSKEFIDLARFLHSNPNWEIIDFEEASRLIKIFFERNKNKFSMKSKTEQRLNLSIGKLNFTGFADRIDFSEEGIEIIDYKTGKSNISPKNRNWQLGYYALAASQLGKVKRITLDMLRHDKPLEFELDDSGIARCDRMSFNIFEVKEEIIETANKILQAYKTGFSPCSIEKNCEFCNEYIYG